MEQPGPTSRVGHPMWIAGLVGGLIGLALGELVFDQSWMWFAGLLVGQAAGAAIAWLRTREVNRRSGQQRRSTGVVQDD